MHAVHLGGSHYTQYLGVALVTVRTSRRVHTESATPP